MKRSSWTFTLIACAASGCGEVDADVSGPDETATQAPVPVLNSISPASVNVGGSDIVVTAIGSAFQENSVIVWNGNDRATTYVNGTSLTTDVSSDQLTAADTVDMFVRSPPPGGGTSATVQFQVGYPMLVAGGWVTCGLDVSGTAHCWGDNWRGGLGDGTTMERFEPTAVIGSVSFVGLAAGGDHACGFDAQGSAYCWGDNWAGGLGDGTTTMRLSPTPVSGGLAFTLLAGGDDFTCGLDPSGTAYCWGYNYNGQLGDGTATDRPVPTPVSGGQTFTQLAAGAEYTCGLDAAGTAFCWGRYYSRSPTVVGSGITFVELAAGDDHTCGLDPSGAAYCWGDNLFGQLGDGTHLSREQPAQVTGGLTWVALGGGHEHTCGIEPSGAAHCWGRNMMGQIGDGTATQDRTEPTLVAGDVEFVSLTGGGRWHICGVSAAGTAFCWGTNKHGQLGVGTAGSELCLGSGELECRLSPAALVDWP